MSKNEAAEQLTRQLRGWITESGALAHAEANLSDALTAERRATVERIRARLLLNEGLAVPEQYIKTILDEEAAR